jgi:hypothetical protein
MLSSSSRTSKDDAKRQRFADFEAVLALMRSYAFRRFATDPEEEIDLGEVAKNALESAVSQLAEVVDQQQAHHNEVENGSVRRRPTRRGDEDDEEEEDEDGEEEDGEEEDDFDDAPANARGVGNPAQQTRPRSSASAPAAPSRAHSASAAPARAAPLGTAHRAGSSPNGKEVRDIRSQQDAHKGKHLKELNLPQGVKQHYLTCDDALDAVQKYEQQQGFAVARKSGVGVKGANGSNWVVMCTRGCSQDDVEWRIKPGKPGRAYISSFKRKHTCDLHPVDTSNPTSNGE